MRTFSNNIKFLCVIALVPCVASCTPYDKNDPLQNENAYFEASDRLCGSTQHLVKNQKNFDVIKCKMDYEIDIRSRQNSSFLPEIQTKWTQILEAAIKRDQGVISKEQFQLEAIKARAELDKKVADAERFRDFIKEKEVKEANLRNEQNRREDLNRKLDRSSKEYQANVYSGAQALSAQSTFEPIRSTHSTRCWNDGYALNCQSD